MTTLEAFEKLWNHADTKVTAKVGGFDILLDKDQIAEVYSANGTVYVLVKGMDRQEVGHETMNLYHRRFYAAKSAAIKGREQRLLDKVNKLLGQPSVT